MVVIKFIICAVLIYIAGSKLSKYGDIIAEKSGLGHAFIGVVLLSAVTSLPELFNGISAVAFVKVPDLAVGNIVGACLINLSNIGMLEIIQGIRRKESILAGFDRSNRLILGFGILISSLFAFGVILAKKVFDFSFFGVGIYTILILAAYLFSQYKIFNIAKCENQGEKELEHQKISAAATYLKFTFFALVVVACGLWLPYIGDELALTFNLGKTFVGVLFLSIATTMPELVVSSTSLKYSSSMALGNFLGSNIFNMSLLSIDDIFYRAGSLFSVVSFSQFVVGLFLLSSFIMLYLYLKLKLNRYLISVFLVLSYVVGLAAAYLIK